MTYPPHTSDPAGGASRITRSSSTLRRAALAVAVVALVVLGVAACGGAPPSSPATTNATTNAPAGGSGSPGASAGFFQQALAYAHCMRAHGVRDYPDPNGNGSDQSINQAGIDPNSPTYKAAAQACRKDAPPGQDDPNQRAQAQAQQLKFAQCMRSHGEPKFPDPGASAGGSGSGGPQSVTQYGIDPNTPTFKAADKACQSLLTAGGGGGS